MLLTALPILFTLAALLRGLRHGAYLAHCLLVGSATWAFERHQPGIAAFSAEALWVFLVLHLAGINFVTLAAYGWDKTAAEKRHRRIPERCLHALTLVGGTFGALAGQKLFRHKTRKTSFRRVFWLTAWLQIVLLCLFWALAR